MIFAGMQVGYAIQANLGTSQLLLLGMSERTVSLAWLAGPISGLVMQPIVGYASDRCRSRFGKRLPFIVAGTLGTAASLILFANATTVSRLLFAENEESKKWALVVAVVAFFTLDFSLQVVQAPARALVIEAVRREERAAANAWLAAFSGFGALVAGGLAASRPLHSYPTFFGPFFSSDVQAIFALSATFLLVTSLPSIFVDTPDKNMGSSNKTTKGTDSSPKSGMNISGSSSRKFADNERREESGIDEDMKMKDEAKGMFQALPLPANALTKKQREDMSTENALSGWRALRAAARPFWQVFAVQLCTWSGYFAVAVYANVWVGRNVFGGDGTAPEGSPARTIFEAGVRLGGTAAAAGSVMTMLTALALPALLRSQGARHVYLYSQLIETFSLCTPFLLRARPGNVSVKPPSKLLKICSVITLSSFGAVSAMTNCVPWTIIGEALESHSYYSRRIGFYTTVFNVSQSFPQLILGLVAPGILIFARNDPSIAMFCAGILAALGAVLIFVLRVDTFADGSIVTLSNRNPEKK